MKIFNQNIIDRAVSYFNPVAGVNRIAARLTIKAVSSGGFSGASKTKHSLKGWGLSDGDADAEMVDSLETLRTRTRDLYKNNPIARGAIRTAVTNVVGGGLKLQASIEREFIGMTDEEADAWEKKTERLFGIWASSKNCDASQRLNFYEIQALVALCRWHTGESFALLPLISREGSISKLCIQVVEADRVSNPNYRMDSERLVMGIETGSFGEPVAYHIQTMHPGSMFSGNSKWQRVAAYGKSGRPNVLHLFTQERPGQRRGIPPLASIIETLRQLGKYTEGTLAAAVVQSFFTAFIKSKSGNPLEGLVDGTDEAGKSAPEYHLGPGAINILGQDDEVTFANPSQPTGAFDVFWNSVLCQIGMALEIPYEVLLKKFNSSYSASRASLLEAWKMFKTQQDWIAQKFCQPIYDEWLADMILNGYISAPGFFDSPEIRAAYCGAEWHGPTQSQIDPVKEIKAASERIQLGVTTLAEETTNLTGGKWETKIRQRAKENRLMESLGILLPDTTGANLNLVDKTGGGKSEESQL